MIINIALLLFLSLVTLWLTSYRRRSLRRWHLQWLGNIPYQNLLDIFLSLIQLGMILVLPLCCPTVPSPAKILTFLGQADWQWQIACYLLLYLMVVIEMTLIILILVVDLGFQRDSRSLFKKMTWLPFRKDRPMASTFLISLVTLTDSLFYLGLLLLLGKNEMLSLAVLILGYGAVKACRYSDGLNQLVAFCLFTVIGLWAVTATLLYGWLVGLLLMTLTYLMISFKEQE
ncbi:SagF family protein [Streptococcus porcinus]|uniref:SagF family protein n=1 Tax=Streptococcus porcinus TaxID=1340 RepID=UPI001961A4E9|nr:SagF family protein [Streptococcus porcinus]